MTTLEAVGMVAIFAAATFITRAVAFALFPASRPTPQYVVYLGRVLPFAITGMLVVYCLRNVTPFTYSFGLPELLAILVVAGIYLSVKNSLLAIAMGTILYMVLVQLVFV